MKRSWSIALVGALLAFTACGDDGGAASPSPRATGVVRPSSTATVAILSPTAGQTVSTQGVTVKVTLRGARLVRQATTTLRPDEGHMHLLVDGRTITLTGGLEVPTGPLTPGPHLIEIEFSANDHGPFNPRVIAQVTVTAA